jgi:hypothetical protein
MSKHQHKVTKFVIGQAIGGACGMKMNSAQGTQYSMLVHCTVWHYRLSSFQGRDTKLERFLAKVLYSFFENSKTGITILYVITKSVTQSLQNAHKTFKTYVSHKSRQQKIS